MVKNLDQLQQSLVKILETFVAKNYLKDETPSQRAFYENAMTDLKHLTLFRENRISDHGPNAAPKKDSFTNTALYDHGLVMQANFQINFEKVRVKLSQFSLFHHHDRILNLHKPDMATLPDLTPIFQNLSRKQKTAERKRFKKATGKRKGLRR